MPRDPRTLPGTLAHLAMSGQELIVHCETCWHRESVDLPTQINAHGGAYRLQSFIDHATCTKCGARPGKLHIAIMPFRKTG